MSNTTDKIWELEHQIAVLKKKNDRERSELINQFNNKMNQLINQTPTGDLRDELTHLNILFLGVVDSIA